MPVWKKTFTASYSAYVERSGVGSFSLSLGSGFTSLINAGFTCTGLSVAVDTRNDATSGRNYQIEFYKNRGTSQSVTYQSWQWNPNAWGWITVTGAISNHSQILDSVTTSNNVVFCVRTGDNWATFYTQGARATLTMQKTTTVTKGNIIYVNDFKINDSFYVPSSLAKGNPIKYGSIGSVIYADVWNAVTINL